MTKSSIHRFRVTMFAVLLACGVILPAARAQQDIQVTTTFDKRSAQVDEEITLKIQVKGATGNIQAPRLPAFDGFDTFYTGRASQLTFVNGNSTSSVEFSYMLVPKRAGSYTLPPIEVTVSGRKFRTDTITLTITGSQGRLDRQSAPPPPLPAQSSSAPAAPMSSAPGGTPNYSQPPAPESKPEDDNIFVHAWTDKQEVYVNEQILLTYSLYTRYDTRTEGFDEEPEVSGFWIEEFPMDRDIEREAVNLRGKRYIKASIRQMALFPTAAASYTIDPGKLRVSIRQQPQQTSIFDDFFDDSFFSGGGFFARRENRLLVPPPILITVKPLPENGKPASFQGAVGNFTMKATLSETDIMQNEPVTMTLLVEGQGNIETLNRPAIPDMPDFKVYESDTSSQLFKTGTVIGGQKRFEIVFIPKKAGEQIIPPLEFSYFNPQTERYVPLRTPEFKLNVKPSKEDFELPTSLSTQKAFKKDIKKEGRDIRFIWERLPNGKLETAFQVTYRIFQGLAVLLTMLFFYGLLRRRTQKIYSKDNALRRRRQAKARAQEGIKRLKPLMRSGSTDKIGQYFEEVDKIITQYVADKCDLSAYGGTRMEIENQLGQTLGKEDPLYRQIMELYQICDESRFGKFEYALEHKKQAYDILTRAINRMEKVIK